MNIATRSELEAHVYGTHPGVCANVQSPGAANHGWRAKARRCELGKASSRFLMKLNEHKSTFISTHATMSGSEHKKTTTACGRSVRVRRGPYLRRGARHESCYTHMHAERSFAVLRSPIARFIFVHSSVTLLYAHNHSGHTHATPMCDTTSRRALLMADGTVHATEQYTALSGVCR